MTYHVMDQFDTVIYAGTRQECEAYRDELYITGQTLRITPRIEYEHIPDWWEAGAEFDGVDECSIDQGVYCAPDCRCAREIEELAGEVMA